jgi:hypothetical protein
MFREAGAPATIGYVASATRSLTLEFNTASELHNFKSVGPATSSADGRLRLTPEFGETYSTCADFKASLDDMIDTGLAIIGARYDATVPFTPGRQYSRKDASRLLNWSSNMYSTIYGYRVDAATRTCPIFVTLHKSDEVSSSTAYEDELVTTQTMRYYTKSKRTLISPDVSPMIANTVDLHVFAKKDDAEGSGFYYLGKARSANPEQTTMRGSALPVVRMLLHFDEPIQAALFDYFHTDLTN